jgi:hypothetical protein
MEAVLDDAGTDLRRLGVLMGMRGEVGAAEARAGEADLRASVDSTGESLRWDHRPDSPVVPRLTAALMFRGRMACRCLMWGGPVEGDLEELVELRPSLVIGDLCLDRLALRKQRLDERQSFGGRGVPNVLRLVVALAACS